MYHRISISGMSSAQRGCTSCHSVAVSGFGGKAGTGLNEIIGGWRLSGLRRWTSALPFSVVDTRGFTNNFLFNDFMVQTGPVQSGLFHDPVTGAPVAFPNPAAVVAGVSITPDVPATLTPLRFAHPGEAGSRNAFRAKASLASTRAWPKPGR